MDPTRPCSVFCIVDHQLTVSWPAGCCSLQPAFNNVLADDVLNTIQNVCSVMGFVHDESKATVVLVFNFDEVQAQNRMKHERWVNSTFK